MTPLTTGDMMHVYGAFGEKVDYTVRLTLRLADGLDPAILRRALDRTQARYPYLSLHLCQGAESLYYEPNPEPVALLHTDRPARLHSPETNGQLWSVAYCGDRLHLDFFHGLTDGTGMYRVLATLLYYYCSERYGLREAAGVLTLAEPPRAEETLDPQDRLAELETPESDPVVYKPAFTLETDGGLTPAPPTIWDVEIPEEPFIRFTAQSDASPGTMVSLLLAHAIDELYPDRGKDVIGAYVINARPMLGAELTHHNCLSMALLDYDERVRAMPFERQCTVYRGMTFVQSEQERVFRSMAASARQIRQVAQSAGSLAEKERLFGQAFSGGEGVVSYLVSYTGKWKQAALGAYVREFWTHPPNTFSLMAELAAVNGKIFLSIQQRFREDTVRKAFLRQLEKHAVPYELKRVMPSDIARLGGPQPR